MTITADLAIYAPAWHADGNCADLADDTMYPDAGDRWGEKEAKKLCEGCPVAADCLGESMARRDFFGVRAGLTGGERKNLADDKPAKRCNRCNDLFVPRLDTQVRCRPCARLLDGNRARNGGKR